MKRLFFGVEVPEPEKAALMDVVHKGRKYLKGVKWVASECLHVTLKFLGNTPDALVGDVVSAAHLAAQGTGPLVLRLKEVGSFSGLNGPRILWVGVEGDVSGLRQLAEALEEQLEMLGFTPEPRPFTAHVTLGRAGERNETGNYPVWENTFSGAVLAEFTASRFVLYESELTPRGPMYTPLARIELKG